ncbi:MAG: diacylglycerol kinase [Patescibacteria group bacterium]|jgi:diacylglycerol kinase
MIEKIRQTIRSFQYAARGLWYVIRRERTFQIHIIATLVVVALSVVYPLKTWEIIILIIMIVLVLVLEIANTAVEKIIDALKPRLHFYVQVAKDLMAAAVLVAAIGAIIIALLIFWPYF